MDKIIYTDLNTGDVRIMTPFPVSGLTTTQTADKDVPKYRAFVLSGESDADAKTRLSVSDLDVTIPYRITDDTNLPSDKEFRVDWVDTNPVVDVDLTAAKVTQEGRVRAARDLKWPEFDSRYNLAVRDSASLTELDVERQGLQDIPNDAQVNIDAAADVAALKAAWPSGLV